MTALRATKEIFAKLWLRLVHHILVKIMELVAIGGMIFSANAPKISEGKFAKIPSIRAIRQKILA